MDDHGDRHPLGGAGRPDQATAQAGDVPRLPLQEQYTCTAGRRGRESPTSSGGGPSRCWCTGRPRVTATSGSASSARTTPPCATGRSRGSRGSSRRGWERYEQPDPRPRLLPPGEVGRGHDRPQEPGRSAEVYVDGVRGDLRRRADQEPEADLRRPALPQAVAGDRAFTLRLRLQPWLDRPRLGEEAVHRPRLLGRRRPARPRGVLLHPCPACRQPLPPGLLLGAPRLSAPGHASGHGGGRLVGLPGPGLRQLAGRHPRRRAFPLPRSWTRWVSIDYGYANPFCALWFAARPTRARSTCTASCIGLA